MNIKQAKANAADQAEQGVTITIYQPSGEPYLAPDGQTEVTVTVVGAESKRVRRANEANQRLLMRSANPEPADLLQGRINRAAAAVIAWAGPVDDATGQPLECTREHVKEMLEMEHVLEQVEAAIRNHAALFTKRSA